ncbi:MAG TPA: hypothetical protein VK131_13510, partial [Candidatus Acidoferrales bacterium]|nr:hypothetical protein [Candidatus Acidoferrales bacterium]
MKVLTVVPSLAVGGTENYVARVLPLLQDRGLEVEVCALDPAGPLAEELRAGRIPVHGTSFGRWTRRSRTPVLL